MKWMQVLSNNGAELDFVRSFYDVSKVSGSARE